MNARMIVRSLTFGLLLAVVNQLPLAAQINPTPTSDSGSTQKDEYIIQTGDNLWNLAGARMGDPFLWEKIYQKNPFLREPGRRFNNSGVVIVRLHPGEVLNGLSELGITPSFTPINALGIKAPEAVVIHNIPTWAWWPLVLAVLLLIGCGLVYWILTRDPVNSGPAMILGGVSDTNAQTALQQFAARVAGNNPGASRIQSVYQQFTVLEQTIGRIWGIMNTLYADGRSVPHLLSGERAYKAEVRFPDGHTEVLYMLQGCGNDLRFGGISRHLPGAGFRFEADPVVAPVAPQTEVVAEPAAAAPVPEPVVETTPETPEVIPAEEPAPEASLEKTPVATAIEPQLADGVVRFEIRRAHGDQPAMVRMSGVNQLADTTCELQEGSVTFRFSPQLRRIS